MGNKQSSLRLSVPRFMAVILLVLAFFASPVGVTHAYADSDDMMSLINEYRSQNGLNKLVRLSIADSAAYDWSVKMAGDNKLSHKPKDSVYLSRPYKFSGENVAYRSVSGNDAQKLMDSLISSSGHRRNLLNANDTHIGIGWYEDSGTIWVTQIFLQEVVASTPTPTPTPKPTPVTPTTPTPKPVVTPKPTPVTPTTPTTPVKTPTTPVKTPTTPTTPTPKPIVTPKPTPVTPTTSTKAPTIPTTPTTPAPTAPIAVTPSTAPPSPDPVDVITLTPTPIVSIVATDVENGEEYDLFSIPIITPAVLDSIVSADPTASDAFTDTGTLVLDSDSGAILVSKEELLSLRSKEVLFLRTNVEIILFGGLLLTLGVLIGYAVNFRRTSKVLVKISQIIDRVIAKEEDSYKIDKIFIAQKNIYEKLKDNPAHIPQSTPLNLDVKTSQEPSSSDIASEAPEEEDAKVVKEYVINADEVLTSGELEPGEAESVINTDDVLIQDGEIVENLEASSPEEEDIETSVDESGVLVEESYSSPGDGDDPSTASTPPVFTPRRVRRKGVRQTPVEANTATDAAIKAPEALTISPEDSVEEAIQEGFASSRVNANRKKFKNAANRVKQDSVTAKKKRGGIR